MHRSTRWIVAAALGLATLGATTAATAGVSAPSGAAPRAAQAAEGVQIGSTTLGTDLKVTLRAYRQEEDTARVYVAAFRYANGAWQPAWQERVPGTWFWFPLTGTGGVCSLAVGNQPQAAPTVDVSLLITPSIGCSDPLHFTIE
ncbi:MAG TPA: hypothetical protein VE465_04600 [Streptosporangiaceae bacterium]|jgi:hypothetical protein|nr:hypothetical protein [Streptosporangiaceae bacterium]